MSKLPIGLRNNNPGNIRVSKTKFRGEVPTDNAFKKFDTIVNGYRAMFILLRNYWRYHALDTISGIINRYAPSCENNTRAYIDYVSSATNIAPDAKIDFNNMMPLVSIVYAMAFMETGHRPDAHEVVEGYLSSLSHV